MATRTTKRQRHQDTDGRPEIEDAWLCLITWLTLMIFFQSVPRSVAIRDWICKAGFALPQPSFHTQDFWATLLENDRANYMMIAGGVSKTNKNTQLYDNLTVTHAYSLLHCVEAGRHVGLLLMLQACQIKRLTTSTECRRWKE